MDDYGFSRLAPPEPARHGRLLGWLVVLGSFSYFLIRWLCHA